MRKGTKSPQGERVNAAALIDAVLPPVSRAKQLARILECTPRQARRYIERGYVPPSLWEHFVLKARKFSAENAQRVEAITLKLKAIEYAEMAATGRACCEASVGPDTQDDS